MAKQTTRLGTLSVLVATLILSIFVVTGLPNVAPVMINAVVLAFLVPSVISVAISVLKRVKDGGVSELVFFLTIGLTIFGGVLLMQIFPFTSIECS